MHAECFLDRGAIANVDLRESYAAARPQPVEIRQRSGPMESVDYHDLHPLLQVVGRGVGSNKPRATGDYRLHSESFITHGSGYFENFAFAARSALQRSTTRSPARRGVARRIARCAQLVRRGARQRPRSDPAQLKAPTWSSAQPRQPARK